MDVITVYSNIYRCIPWILSRCIVTYTGEIPWILSRCIVTYTGEIPWMLSRCIVTYTGEIPWMLSRCIVKYTGEIPWMLSRCIMSKKSIYNKYGGPVIDPVSGSLPEYKPVGGLLMTLR